MASSKFVAGLILGAAAGTLIALFANSDKGQDVWDDVSSKGKDLWDDVKDSADDWQDVAKSKYDDWKDKAKSKYGDTSDNLNDLISEGKKYIAKLEKKAKDVKDAATS
ncbi:MAG: YtxH domain-containing protein [Bacteroidota bacterium]|nr:YtxH domain-containing protein [Bacteroidota bacterium]